ETAAPIAFEETRYVGSGQLTVRPSPAEEIRLPSPIIASNREAVTAILLIFIDEQGTVDSVKVDNLGVPQPFREAAESAFAKAHFHPGMVGDRPVKSRMRVEVTFEAVALTSDDIRPRTLGARSDEQQVGP